MTSRLKFERDVAVAALRAIKRATVEGRVCDDVAWFDEIETLHDFCDRIIAKVMSKDSASDVKGAQDHG